MGYHAELAARVEGLASDLRAIAAVARRHLCSPEAEAALERARVALRALGRFVEALHDDDLVDPESIARAQHAVAIAQREVHRAQALVARAAEADPHVADESEVARKRHALVVIVRQARMRRKGH